MPKRKIKEEKPKKKLGKKELLIAPIAMGAATLVALVIVPNFAPPPNPTEVCLKAHNIETFQLFPKVELIVDGQPKMLPDDVGRQSNRADGDSSGSEECLRPIHTDKVGNEIHIEYIRPVRLTMADFMKIYSYDGSTITVVDNSTTGGPVEQILELNKYDVRYSYFSKENQNCDGTYEDKDCYTYLNRIEDSPPFTKEMLARIELTSKQ